jgi:P4 family phage/plasmid primase-like protien
MPPKGEITMSTINLPADINAVDAVDALIELHGDDLRYHFINQTWLTFDPSLGWTWDHQGTRINELVVATLRHLENLVPAGLDITRTKKFARTRRSCARQMLNSGGLNGIIKLASRRAELNCPDAVIDAEPYFVGTPNGVLDLHSGEVTPFDRSHVITRRLPVAYYPEATCERWTRFLSETLGEGQSVHDYFQELLGYTLSGETREQKMWLFVGNGANGKSTLLRMMLNVLGGDYAQQTPDAVLFGRTSSGGASSELVRLKGYRCAALAETDYGQAISEGRVKTLVAGDTIAARGLYQEYQEFTPQAKYFLATNHLPPVWGSDKGIWRRLVVVPFDHEFEVGSDPTLMSDLTAELPGILAWAVKGAIRWYQNGHLPTLPTSWQDATSRYRAEQDTVTAFLDECAVMESSASVGATELLKAFTVWCRVEGRQPLGQQDFGRRMTSTGLVRRGPKGKDNRKHYFGLKLRAAADEAELGRLVDAVVDDLTATPPCTSLFPPDTLLTEATP